MKIYAAVLAVLFVLFAWFQLNDPDPVLWVTMYMVLAALAGLKLAGRLRDAWRWFGMGMCAILLLQTFPGLWDYLTNQEG